MRSNFFLFLSALLFWSATWSIIGLTQVNIDLDPSVSVFTRFVLAGFIILIYVAITKRKLIFSLRDHVYFFILGIFLYSGNYIFFYNSNVYLPSNIPATVFCLLTIFNILGEKFLFKKPITTMTLLGAILGISGILIIFFNDFISFDLNSGTTIGLMFALLATLSASAGNLIAIYNKRNFSIPLLQNVAFAMIYGALVALLVSFIRGSEFYIPITNVSYILGQTYLIIFGSIISFLCYIKFIENTSASTGGYIGVVMPILALIISMIFEDVKPDIYFLTGLPIALVGLLLILKQESAKG
ncbi:MAG: EamA family transporter [Pelagibacteraceae bacterium]|nr:EamA family transporter [Pelagibacteraceae bacterium]|tara:strand:+ start:1193 stop:2089 length:897 start_codon:yes stop_codon:yes gene_type:complete